MFSSHFINSGQGGGYGAGGLKPAMEDSESSSDWGRAQPTWTAQITRIVSTCNLNLINPRW